MRKGCNNITILKPNHDQFRVGIQWPKNNKAAGYDGVPVKLFKDEGNEQIGCMHASAYFYSQTKACLLIRISLLSWKKGKPIICVSHRDISQLSIAYKVLTSITTETKCKTTEWILSKRFHVQITDYSLSNQ